jgi:CheY-like chemotaxis protein
MDIRRPELDGLSETRRIKSKQPQTKILVLSLHDSSAEDAMIAGADAFMSKGESPAHLLDAVTALESPLRPPGHCRPWGAALTCAHWRPALGSRGDAAHQRR